MRNVTIYRKCLCGETAHDYTGDRDASGRRVFACRNCRRRVLVKRRRKFADRATRTRDYRSPIFSGEPRRGVPSWESRTGYERGLPSRAAGVVLEAVRACLRAHRVPAGRAHQMVSDHREYILAQAFGPRGRTSASIGGICTRLMEFETKARYQPLRH